MSKKLVTNLRTKEKQLLDLTSKEEASNAKDEANFIKDEEDKIKHKDKKDALLSKMGLNADEIKTFEQMLKEK